MNRCGTDQPESGESIFPKPQPADRPEAGRLRELSPRQWKSGVAAWLGWLFDGLDMHLYTIVAAPFVAQLLEVASPADPLVKEKSSWIQAAFLVGWAVGGSFFGRLGDLIGRSRALALTILTYALFTGLSFFAQTWWHLLCFRFLAALGIGGEWAVGSSLLSETWPKRWRPWIAAVLQTGSNLGVLIACGVVIGAAEFAPAIQSAVDAVLPATMHVKIYPRLVFLAGVVPALLVFWIRRSVPEPEEWRAAKAQAGGRKPGVADLFKRGVRRTTLLTTVVCAASLTAWWAFLFWNPQHLRNLPGLAARTPAERDQWVSIAFFIVICVSMSGNFFGACLARWLGFRRAIALMLLGFFGAMFGTYCVPRDYASLMWWIPWVGFFAGVFGLFTMYLPPLFPTLLRTTGAGFCFNVGRVAAAVGTIVFGLYSQVGDFRQALFVAGFLFLLAMGVALLMPEMLESPSRE